MSLSSSSKHDVQSTSNTTNTESNIFDSVSGTVVKGGNGNINFTDMGAVNAAFDFGRENLQMLGDTFSTYINASEQQTNTLADSVTKANSETLSQLSSLKRATSGVVDAQSLLTNAMIFGGLALGGLILWRKKKA